MQIKKKLKYFYEATNNKFFTQFGFKIEDVTFSKIVDYLHTPKDSSSLAVTRILFGLAMLFDIPDERGGASMEKRWGNPKICHFPLFPFIRAMDMPYMAAVYAGLWFGAIGIMLGYKYRYSAATFTICYWYLILVEKSYWNNHSYLFGLVALLLTCSKASCYWSIDAYLDPSRSKPEVPYWNYFILKYQFFILYFMAGLKKGTAEWLTGYSVQNLSEHWVFVPFKYFLTVPQIDYLVVHWFIFMFDLTVALWMMWSSTRNVAMAFCTMFHLMNSRLFRIGMFPWVCLATMPLFFPFNWPKKLLEKFAVIKNCLSKLSILKSQECNCNMEVKYDGVMNTDTFINDQNNDEQIKADFQNCQDIVSKELCNDDEKEIVKAAAKINGGKQQSTGCDRKFTVYLIIFHVLSQAFLPYSHFITQGYNNWTSGLYGYSWDMMVHTWKTHAIIVQVVDNEKHNEFYVDPYIYAPNDRWTRHGDMVYQYARCLRENLMEDAERFKVNNERVISNNISIYVDIWCSMNERFTQRLFNPKVDILKEEWSPFQKIPFLMPLLDEALHWRADLQIMMKEVHSWNNYSDAIFLADFPGYDQEKYISEDLENVTLTILEGNVAYQPEITKYHNRHSVQLSSGDQLSVANGIFHKVLNIGHKPAFYMYTFYNSSEIETEIKKVSILPVFTELYNRFYRMLNFCFDMSQNLFQVFFCITKC